MPSTAVESADRAADGGSDAGSPLPPDDSPYWTFYEEVATRQVAAWAPEAPSRVLDLSGGRARFADQLVAAGHEVVHVCEAPVAVDAVGPGRLLQVLADARSLDWLADASVDAVLAESRALSRCLATEVTVAELRRVLRPGGRLLLVVESLGLGLARLAGQGRWAQLADVPNADVVLVSGPGDGPITRCFWPEELAALLGDAGLEVEWVRPRTVLAPSSVERALAGGGRAALAALLTTELALSTGPGEQRGLHLVASARRPDPGGLPD